MIKKTALTVAAFLTVAAVANAATLLTYDTAASTSNPTLAPSFTDPALGPVLDLTQAGGLTANFGGTWNWNNWDPANASFGDALASDDFWIWGFQAGALPVDLNFLDIRLDTSGTGPAEFEIQASVNAGAPIAITGVVPTNSSGQDYLGIPLGGIPTLNPGDQVQFFLGAWGSTSTGGTMDLETITGQTYGLLVDGTVIPEPATMALLGLGGVALLRRRK